MNQWDHRDDINLKKEAADWDREGEEKEFADRLWGNIMRIVRTRQAVLNETDRS